MVGLLDEMVGLFTGVEGSGNGGLELMFKLQSTEMFRSSDGQKMMVGILKDGSESLEVLNTGFAIVAAAATSN
uniref:Uncharacterized protein n=1 Tax=Populus trichocarpa TaxID=3694 RepID=A0A2K1R7X0_POPTR